MVEKLLLFAVILFLALRIPEVKTFPKFGKSERV